MITETPRSGRPHAPLGTDSTGLWQPCARQGDWIVDPLIRRGDNQRKSEPEGSSRGNCRQRCAACPGRMRLHAREKESHHETPQRLLPACLVASSALAWCDRRTVASCRWPRNPAKPQSLFNGKDLTGWVTPDDKAFFSVEDGEIVGRTQGEPQEERVPGHREALSRFRAQGQGQVQERQLGNPVPQQAYGRRRGLGTAGRRRRRLLGLLYEERGRGILERYPEDKAKELVKNGDWNEFVITAKGKHVTIDLNGTRIIDRTDEQFDDEGIIAFKSTSARPWRSASRTSRSRSCESPRECKGRIAAVLFLEFSSGPGKKPISDLVLLVHS